MTFISTCKFTAVNWMICLFEKGSGHKYSNVLHCSVTITFPIFFFKFYFHIYAEIHLRVTVMLLHNIYDVTDVADRTENIQVCRYTGQ